MEKLFSFDFVGDTQAVFRQLLDALAKPMTPHSIIKQSLKFPFEHSEILSIGATLLDNETTFYVEKDTQLQNTLSDLTLAKQSKPETSDYIFISSELNYETIKSLFTNAKKGTFADPQLSATFIIKCNTFEGNEKMTLKSPGINGEMTINTSKYIKEICKLHNEIDTEYPCGIDIYFVNENGIIMGFPRLCRVQKGVD